MPGETSANTWWTVCSRTALSWYPRYCGIGLHVDFLTLIKLLRRNVAGVVENLTAIAGDVTALELERVQMMFT